MAARASGHKIMAMNNIAVPLSKGALKEIALLKFYNVTSHNNCGLFERAMTLLPNGIWQNVEGNDHMYLFLQPSVHLYINCMGCLNIHRSPLDYLLSALHISRLARAESPKASLMLL